jgi:hypothetical protein
VKVFGKVSEAFYTCGSGIWIRDGVKLRIAVLYPTGATTWLRKSGDEITFLEGRWSGNSSKYPAAHS